MQSKQKKMSRRNFLQLGGLATAGIAFAGVPRSLIAKESALPAGKTAAPSTDMMVKALNYHADATKVEKAKFPTYKPGQKCSNCNLYKPVNDGWGECGLIKAGLVASGGWCSSWAKKG